MSFRNEKHGDELKQYLVTTCDYLRKAKQTVSWSINGLIYNVPFTAGNRPAFAKALTELMKAEEALKNAMGSFGELK